MIENSLIKAANKPEFYSQEQLAEFIKCIDPVTGPAHFMQNYFYIQHPVKGKMLYQPFEYQKKLAEVYHNYRFSINLLGRQLGKCCSSESRINIRNKQGIIYDIPIGKFYEYEAAKRNNTELPDISQYQRQEV